MPRALSTPAVKRLYTRVTLALLGVLFLLILVVTPLLVSRFYALIQAHDGEWHLTRIIVLSKGRDNPLRIRRYLTGTSDYGNDMYIRQDWDWEGDGIYDCRESILESVPGSVLRVYYPRQGEWVLAPAEVRNCQQRYH
ncbi:hypothetical protein JRI60_47865 [Archangium violaceum]|uniref:hypothetical protein n=1 Tax=Archangium violaceum TaxID=83451 RepID=UPI0019522AC4|nr:hypothetical protein [Archangium violaceum]QRN96633.1 hypothetical protein JRI60_47865 [Archangium violaceum]